MGSVQDNAHEELSEETELNQSLADMFVAANKSGRLFDYLKEKQEELERGQFVLEEVTYSYFALSKPYVEFNENARSVVFPAIPGVRYEATKEAESDRTRLGFLAERPRDGLEILEGRRNDGRGSIQATAPTGAKWGLFHYSSSREPNPGIKVEVVD